jgi:hypothetical protein
MIDKMEESDIDKERDGDVVSFSTLFIAAFPHHHWFKVNLLCLT